jgi:hypothetical protein
VALVTTVLRTTTTAATAANALSSTGASLTFSTTTSAITSPSGQYELKYDQRANSLSLKDKWQPQVRGSGWQRAAAPAPLPAPLCAPFKARPFKPL